MHLPDTFLYYALDIMPFILLISLCCCLRVKPPRRVDVDPQRVPLLVAAPVLSSETLGCAICLEPLRHGAECGEVRACGHVFHRDCVKRWVKKSNTCPLCRAQIVPKSGGASAAENMV
ncbi:hypothetical protein EJB05_50049, partial [Eragrostis curvula]